jgi:hypothetical protein
MKKRVPLMTLTLLLISSLCKCQSQTDIEKTNLAGKTSLRSDGIMLVDGSPFFVQGFWLWSGSTYGQLCQAADQLAGSKINTVYASNYANITAGDFASAFDYFNTKGIKVMADGISGSVTGSVLDKSNLIGWYTCDDANGKSVTTVESINNSIKAADPNHLTFISNYSAAFGLDITASTITSYYNANTDCDIVQSYPLETTKGATLIDVFNDVHNKIVPGANAASPKKCPMVYLQAFSWSVEENNGPWPTPAQIDLVNYEAIAGGIKGIMWYAFPDYSSWHNGGTNNLPISQPALWDQLKQVAIEVDFLKDVYLNGTLTVNHNSGINLIQSYWEYKGNVYVIIINLASSSQNSSVTIPVSNGILSSVFSTHPNTMTLSNSILSGSIASNTVEVLKVTTK